MNIRLLKINAMKRFTRWLDINNVHPALWNEWMWNSKTFMGLHRRQEQADERNKFCRNRKGKSLKGLEYDRFKQGSKANQLLNYITTRKKRHI